MGELQTYAVITHRVSLDGTVVPIRNDVIRTHSANDAISTIAVNLSEVVLLPDQELRVTAAVIQDPSHV